MKRIVFFLCAILISAAAWSKDHKPSYVESHDPSPDSLMTGFSVLTDGGVYTITGVDSVRGASAKQLFAKIKDWISTVYNEPGKVIKSETAPSLLVFEGQLCGDIDGRVLFRFKDGRYRMEITSLKLTNRSSVVKYVHFSSKAVEKVPRYYINFMPRSGKWLLADIYEYLQRIRSVAHKVERAW